MGNARTFFLLIAAAFLSITIAANVQASEKIVVLQYQLKPVESVESGKYIKTEWNAKIRNRASEPVNFSITIAFLNNENEVLKETTSKHSLLAQETKSFKDTMLLEASIASKVSTTKVILKEIPAEGTAP